MRSCGRDIIRAAPRRPVRAGFGGLSDFTVGGHKDVTTTQIYTHVMQKPGLGVKSPAGRADGLNLKLTFLKSVSHS